MIREALDTRKDKIEQYPSEFHKTLMMLTRLTKRETVLDIIAKDSSKWRDACQFEFVKNFDYVPSMLKKGFESVATQENLSAQYSETKKVAADILSVRLGWKFLFGPQS